MNNDMTTRFFKMDFGRLVLGAAFLMVHIGNPAVAQDIEIIGSDGKQVDIVPPVDGAQNIPRVGAEAAPNQGVDQGRGTGLTVVGPDGQPMFLPTEDARSVQIQRSVSTQVVDGQRAVVQKGTAIVVDAQGQRREFELAETDDVDGLATMQPNQKPEVKKSWMIGAVCLPAPEMVRSQLGLDESTGLLVKQIQPGSPADIGGLKKFDVLLYADDQQLSSVKDLTTVVNEVGQEDGVISMTVVRGGDEIPIEVQPTERDYAAMPMRRMPMDMFEMNDMGPGILFGGRGGDGAGMNRMREMMQRQMDQMKEEFQNMDALIQEGLPLELPMPRMEPR
jgi:hypothetical protein